MEHRAQLSYVSEDDPWLKRKIIRFVEVWSGQPKIQRLYEELQEMDFEPLDAWGKALDQLQVNIGYNQEQLDRIPKKGPLVIVANHPFGVVDGLMVAHLTTRVRSRFKFLVNSVLTNADPRIEDYLLPIDFEETKEAQAINIQTRKVAIDLLSEGEALVIFPSGGVATAPGGFGRAVDLPWKRFTASVIQRSKATVVPLFVHGQNSRLFQLVSQINMNLRLGLLIHEMTNKIGRELPITIGEPIPFNQMNGMDRQELTDFLRKETEKLGEKESPGRPGL